MAMQLTPGWRIHRLSAQRLREVRAEVQATARVSPAYLIMNAAATLIAGFGLFQNSPAVIIGAMLIAMLMGPIQGLALALAEADAAAIRDAIRSEIVGVLWVLLFGAMVGLLFRHLPVGSEILGRSNPTILDLGVALAGGFAGGYAAVSRKVSSAVVGAAIATALVPPLTACAILLVRGLTGPALGCFLNFFTNFTAIALAQMVVFLLAGFRPPALTGERRRTVTVARTIHLGILGLLAWYLLGTFSDTFGTESLRASLTDRVQAELTKVPGARLASLTLEGGREHPVAWVVVRTPQPLSPPQTADLERSMIEVAGRNLELHVRSVLTVETTAKGFTHELVWPEHAGGG
ncbi:MAG: DUF389 domain-containing protein [Geminicoccaceae bacterium]